MTQGVAKSLTHSDCAFKGRVVSRVVECNIDCSRDLVIQRSQDGHFYTLGKINGREAKFMVDTGASMVSVSEPFAQKAFILGGTPTTFKTANGDQPGRIVEGMGVAIGPVSVSNVSR